MNALARCPHCGAALTADVDRLPPEARAALAIMMGKATVQGAILRRLTQRFGEEVPAADLIAAAYGPFGGPLTLENTFRVHISRLRRLIRPLGLAIVGTRHPAGYRLERRGQI